MCECMSVRERCADGDVWVGVCVVVSCLGRVWYLVCTCVHTRGVPAYVSFNH